MQREGANLTDLDALVRTHYPAVVRLAVSILESGLGPAAAAFDVEGEAEDAAQETFVRAGAALAAFRGECSVKTWLFSIAINACRSRLRRLKARRALAQTLAAAQRWLGAESGGTARAGEQRAERRERDRALWQAVDRLDEKHRLVIVLRYVHELSAAEIAAALDLSEGTVHSRLHTARQQLAGQLRRLPSFEEVETA